MKKIQRLTQKETLKLNLRFIGTLSLFLTICSFAFSQKIQIQGIITDNSSKTPIPYAHVLLKNQNRMIKGEVGAENGGYSISFAKDSINMNDSLYFSCIGYVGFAISAKKLNDTQTLDVQLKPVVYQLSEFVVKPTDFKRRAKSLGYNRWNRCFGKYFFGYGHEIGLYFPNNDSLNGIISGARFYIKDDGFPETKFRVNVYNANANGSPGQPILLESVIVSATEGNQWVVVDLSKYQLEIPKNGFFIAMEWLPESKNKAYKKDWASKSFNGQVLGAVNKDIDEPSFQWSRSLGGDWMNPKYKRFMVIRGIKVESYHFLEPAIGATLKLYKDND
jgi:hypothetical protein